MASEWLEECISSLVAREWLEECISSLVAREWLEECSASLVARKWLEECVSSQMARKWFEPSKGAANSEHVRHVLVNTVNPKKRGRTLKIIKA